METDKSSKVTSERMDTDDDPDEQDTNDNDDDDKPRPTTSKKKKRSTPRTDMKTDKSSKVTSERMDNDNDPDEQDTNDNDDDDKPGPTTSKKKKGSTPIGKGFSNYQKKKLLEHFKKSGYSQVEFQKAVSKFKVDPNTAKAFFNKCMEDAETYVHEECSSLSYINIMEWIELFGETKAINMCNHEAPAMLNAIANNEKLPPPEEMNGVDLKAIYRFLGKAMLGQPQEALTGPTAQFFVKEIGLLVDAANSDDGDADTLALKQMLIQHASTEGFFNFTTKPKKTSIDPLCLDKQI